MVIIVVNGRHEKIWFAINGFIVLMKVLFLREVANGLRYPRWGGRRNAVRLEKC
jgi:hypothetical protein